MDQEKLIECVRLCEPLYVLSNSKYSDYSFKKNAWKKIGLQLNQPAVVCKKTWACLRDSYRRALRKKREAGNGPAALKMRKWKFEDEMSFLLPHLQEKEQFSNLSDNNDEDEERRNYSTRCNKGNRADDGEDNTIDDEDDGNSIGDIESNSRDEKWKTIKKILTKQNRNQSECKNDCKLETAMANVMQHLLDDKLNSNVQKIQASIQECNPLNAFFSSVAATVKTFSPYYQNIAKSKIFQIITDLEMKHILQSQNSEEFVLPEKGLQQLDPELTTSLTTLQQAQQSNQTVSSLQKPSTSSSATPTSLPSRYSPFAEMSCYKEEI